MDIELRAGDKQQVGEHFKEAADKQRSQRGFLHAGGLQDVIKDAGKGDENGDQPHDAQRRGDNGGLHGLMGI